MFIEQGVNFKVTLSEDAIFSDVLLDEPVLLGVRAVQPYTLGDTLFGDGATVCTLVGYPIYFEWEEVVGATNYIFQLCQHQEFVGPTLVTFRVASTEVSPFTAGAIYLMVYAGQTIRKEKAYHYRVFAIGNEGEVSPKSEIWGFTFACELTDPNDVPSSGASGESESNVSESGVLCSYRDSKIVDLEVSSGSGDVSPPTLKYNVYNYEGQLVLSDVSPGFRLSTAKVNAASLGIISVSPESCIPILRFAFESFQEDVCA